MLHSQTDKTCLEMDLSETPGRIYIRVIMQRSKQFFFTIRIMTRDWLTPVFTLVQVLPVLAIASNADVLLARHAIIPNESPCGRNA